MLLFFMQHLGGGSA